MSNNGIPPLNDWQADNYPVIYDEGDETLKYVKTGTKHDINTGSSGYLSYVAYLAQSGTNTPTETFVSTDVSPAPTLGRTEAGVYNINAPGKFTINKTFTPPFGYWSGDATLFMPISDGATVIGYYNFAQNGDGNNITINVFDATFTLVDWSTLCGTSLFPIEIRIYP